ncbi:VanZ family protein [Catenovulum sp. 2E275]|uniref:VanZ family protein n=1 Tax=Catenovulum sp. 2E275 TaxID=2980497 RepID=UPI0021CEC7F0|nr:VanZ family protein [Catenovulum sp. 2E275]MCU4675319.1 VanZ family protein [Catenovulum sp. 2E275]
MQTKQPHFMQNIWLYRGLAAIAYIIATFLFFSPIDPNGGSLFPHFDKFAHCIVFFGLTGLTEFSFNKQSKRIVIALLCYGALVEILQGAFFNRQASFYDLVADASGILLFYLLLTKTKLACFRSWAAAQSAH